MDAPQLMLHSGAREVSLLELGEIPVPEQTKTYQPVWHLDMIATTYDVLCEYGWLPNPDANPDKIFRTAMSGDGGHMFCTAGIEIPGLLDIDSSLAVGERNSYNKSFAASMCFGRRVFICDNLAFSGDIKAVNIHWTGRVNLTDLVKSAFDQLPRLAREKYEWDDRLKGTPITADSGVALLAAAVEKKALPIANFMKARGDFLTAYDGGDVPIKYPGTVWSVYQAATGQYKDIILYRNQGYTTKLEALINGYVERK